MMTDAFDLTPAEARLAAHLASGATLQAVAERLGISKETARNQLKMVFAKTGTNRQAQLVALLARLPGMKLD
jgi:DNA-binding CsgD family transcriptional regulator